MREVVPIGRQPLDGRLARPQDALVIGMRQPAVRVLDDLVGKLTVDGSAEPIHVEHLLLDSAPPGSSASLLPRSEYYPCL